MKIYSILIAFFILLMGKTAFGQAIQSVKYLDSAQAYMNTGRTYKKALDYYELAIKAGNHYNYTYYSASQAACMAGDQQKAMSYGLLSFEKYQDFHNYNFFATDTLNKCFIQSIEGQKIVKELKVRYDAYQIGLNRYVEGISDKKKRVNESALSDSIKLLSGLKSKSAKETVSWIRNFNKYPQPVLRDHWTLYHIKVRDTINMPFLVYVPKNYDPKKKHFLYVYLHGAASQRNQFSVRREVAKVDKEVLLKPMQENAIILYAFSRKDINWINDQDVFVAIEKQIAYTKSLYNIDDNRVYLGGHSDGGRGAFYFATHRPSSFAALYGVCFYPSSYIGNTQLNNLKNNVTFYGISGTDDEYFPVKEVNDVWQYAKKNNANWENFTLTGTHGLPIESPDSTFFVYDKFLKHIRNPFPKRIEWETDDVRNGRNSWLEITQLDTLAEKKEWQVELNPTVTKKDKLVKFNFNKNKSGAVIATAEGNNIEILASRVKGIKLYISADMFDFNKEIQIKVNGKDFMTFKPQADKKVILNEFLQTKDRDFIISQKIDLVLK